MAILPASFVQLHEAKLEPNPARTVTRLEVPYEDQVNSHARTQQLVQRIKALTVAETESLACAVLERFNDNYDNLSSVLIEHAHIVDSVLEERGFRDSYQELLIGSAFTAEFAPESVAICNPTAVAHPDQSDIPRGSLKVALGARAIGEGHISSICFFEAVVDDSSWRFLPHHDHLSLATIDNGLHTHENLDSVAQGYHRKVAMATTVVGEKRSSRTNPTLLGEELEGYRRWRRYALSRNTKSARTHAQDRLYQARFSAETTLSQRILLPEVTDEAHGLEDARLVNFTPLDGPTEYRGCYVAFDGRIATPRLITSGNLREFEIHRLTGPATKDKGLALFPRPVNGEYLALSRTNWQDIALARSQDGFYWRPTNVIYTPEQPWEILKTGNCGSPIELDEGWLVITHGVGPMRCYSFGAFLLDKNNPAMLKAKLTSPLISTEGSGNTGYVPNAIYSCGSIAHNGVLWLPFSEADNRIRIASVEISRLLSNMTVLT